jgi:very-short-patch-repair endonuclease
MKKLTNEEFIEKAKRVHGDKYDYSKVEYNNAFSKICIICPEHGEFYQTPHDHLKKHGCPKCGGVHKPTNAEFIKKVTKKFPLYDFSKSEYINSKAKIKVVCKKHGEFYIRPNDLLNGVGCPKCALETISSKKTKKFDDFVKLANLKHNFKYDYVEKTYINRNTKTKIICPEHGEFWQKPSYHISGCGCPICGNKCNISEQKVYKFIRDKFINDKVYYQYRNKEILGNLTFDVFIENKKIAIEYQGRQHYEPINRFGGLKSFEKTKARDKLKQDLSLKNGIKILYVSFDNKVKKYDKSIIDNFEDLETEILKFY